jgi:hypothetical protein
MWKNVGFPVVFTQSPAGVSFVKPSGQTTPLRGTIMTSTVLKSYTDYHAYTSIKPDFSYEKPWYKHGLEAY